MSEPVTPRGKAIATFDWTEGTNHEWEYSVRVYESCLVWVTDLDPQYESSDPDHEADMDGHRRPTQDVTNVFPREQTQALDDFMTNGAPVGSNCFEPPVRRAVEDVLAIKALLR